MSDPYASLRARFGAALKLGEPLARYTVARLGGPADALLIATRIADLCDAVTLACAAGVPWIVLGGATNVLVADAGYRGLVILNHARTVTFDESGRVRAESGASLSTLARRCISRGWAGLEWAVNVPGTVGGAVVNNAGAHGGDMAASVRRVEVLALVGDTPRMEAWTVERMAYAYRYSALKGDQARHYVVLSAELALATGHDPAALEARAAEFVAHRKRTQPPGASLGSIFKNPPGDYAGRLIEAAGLKGVELDGVQISPVHANFFLNTGGGTARAYRTLVEQAQATVRDRFGVLLETEIEFVGEW